MACGWITQSMRSTQPHWEPCIFMTLQPQFTMKNTGLLVSGGMQSLPYKHDSTVRLKINFSFKAFLLALISRLTKRTLMQNPCCCLVMQRAGSQLFTFWDLATRFLRKMKLTLSSVCFGQTCRNTKSLPGKRENKVENPTMYDALCHSG